MYISVRRGIHRQYKHTQVIVIIRDMYESELTALFRQVTKDQMTDRDGMTGLMVYEDKIGKGSSARHSDNSTNFTMALLELTMLEAPMTSRACLTTQGQLV